MPDVPVALRFTVFLSLALLCASACRPAPPPLATPAGLPPALFPGPGLAALTRARPGPQAQTCSDDVRLAAAMPDPVTVPDREGEWLEIRSDAPVPVALDGWTLTSGRSRLALDGVSVAGDEPVCVGGPHGVIARGKIRLRNKDGLVSLVDPCGVTRSSLRWRRAPPGGVIRAPPPWALNDNGPARGEPSGTVGGCGQT
ncbi:MAG: hypothetical protein R3F39_20865 [Myxococcota bacterium]